MNLLFFILGALFISFINPIADELCNLILTIIETEKGKFAIKIAEYNKKVIELKGKEEKETANVIGFQYYPDDYVEDDEQEEDDD
ncbi:MAG: hypothetical protein LIR50_16065 [Bacillota bacterium]|nr:hypothetical protein [Bacillota bacterium]